jgi:hypothetical protein
LLIYFKTNFIYRFFVVNESIMSSTTAPSDSDVLLNSGIAHAYIVIFEDALKQLELLKSLNAKCNSNISPEKNVYHIFF